MAAPALTPPKSMQGRRGDKNTGNVSLNGTSRWQMFKPDLLLGAFFGFFGNVAFSPSTLVISTLHSPEGTVTSILVAWDLAPV